MSEPSGLQSRFPDPNRPLSPSWPTGLGDVGGGTGGSFWTRGLRGRDRGPMYQGARNMPGSSIFRTVAVELAMALKAAVIWTALWAAVGFGILYGMVGLINLAN